MKVTAPDHLQQLNAATKLRAQETDQGFAKLLGSSQASSTPTTSTTGSTASASALLNSNPMGMIMSAQSATEQLPGKVGQQMESTLDSMEKYASALADPSKNLKSIESLAKDMEKAAAQLTGLSQELPANSPLKGISNDTAVLATVESMKFKRGD